MTTMEKLHAHHEKLIGTIRELVERTKADPAEASLLVSYCGEFLLAHAEAEESTLYNADANAEFVDKMVREHREIKELLESIGNALGTGGASLIISESARFMELLNAHFLEEENILMPRLSNKMSEGEMENLITEAHRVEGEKKRSDIWSLFELDHKRIDLNMSRMRMPGVHLDAARHYYSRMRGQLLKHIELEETVLFPAFEEHANPGQMGPVHVMISEHREIVSIISPSLEDIDEESLRSRTDLLIGKLAVHNKKEELILYPMINRTLQASHRARVFKESFDGLAAA